MALTSIIDLSNKRPRAFVRVSLGAGPRASGAAPIAILLCGNKTEATPTDPLANDTMVQVFGEDEVIAKTGAGSELHRMWLRIVDIFDQATVYLGAIAGSAGANAALSITFTGTATAASTLEITIGCDEPLQIPIANGDTAAAVRAAIIAAVNNVARTPVIASESTNDVVLTAKCEGPRGNNIRVRSRMTEGTGAGLTITTLSLTGAALSGGTTNDSPTNLLAASTSVRFHLTVGPYGLATEDTAIGVMQAHVEAQMGPLVGKRGRLVLGCQSSLGTANTFATTYLNDELAQIAWAQLSNEPPAELAAALAGLLAVEMAKTRAYSLDDLELTGLTPQWDGASQPTETEIVSALNNGLTPLFVAGSEVRVARSITSKSRTIDGGTVADYSVLDTHYVDAAFFIADTIEENWAPAFPQFKLGVDIEGQVPPPKVATANSVKSWCLNLVGGFENDLIENFQATTVSGAIFERNEVAKGRIDAVVPVDIIELFHQFAVDIRQQG